MEKRSGPRYNLLEENPKGGGKGRWVAGQKLTGKKNSPEKGLSVPVHLGICCKQVGLGAEPAAGGACK